MSDGLTMLHPSEVAANFGPAMLSAEACRRFVLRATRGDVVICPWCGVTFDPGQVRRLLDGKKIRCRDCNRSSSRRTGTIFDGCVVDDRQILLILALRHYGRSPDEIAGLAGVCRSSVYNILDRVCKA